jgi:cytochrome d ubiquinol oxidase subunit II
MALLWYALLGCLFAGYLALAGLNYGVGLALPVLARDDDQRRTVLGTLGPLFLGNEVWLVAVIGVLLGGFPLLEHALFARLWPLLLALLLAAVAVSAAVQLRSRARSRVIRGGLDLAVAGSSGLLAVGWGAVLGDLLGARAGTSAGGAVLGWVPVTIGAATVALIALHGSGFLAWRLPGGALRDAAGRAFVRLLPAAATAFALATVVAVASGQVRAATRQPVAALTIAGLALGAIGLAGWAHRAGRPRLTVVASGLATAAPVFITGVATYPYAAGLPVSAASAGGATLELLSWIVLPVLPLLLLAQVACWWMLRPRPGLPELRYW